MSIALRILALMLGPQPEVSAPAGLLRRPAGSSRAPLDAHNVY